MKNLMILGATILFFGLTSITAFAVAVDNCPTSFKAEISSVRVYQTSILQNDPAWVTARNSLRTASADKTLVFVLTKKTKPRAPTLSPEGPPRNS